MLKTINRQQKAIDIRGKHFLHNDIDNQLYEVEGIDVFFDFEGNKVYHFKNGEKTLSLPAGSFQLYFSRGDYEKGIDCMLERLFEIKPGMFREQQHVCIKPDTDHFLLTSVVFKDNVPVETEDIPAGGFICDTAGLVSIVFNDCNKELEEYFATVAQAIRYHDYKYTDEEGNVKTAGGTHVFALLTEEQRKAVDAMKKAWDAMLNTGVKVALDCDYYRLYFINGEKARFDYYEENREFMVEDLPKVDVFPTGGINCFYGSGCYEDKPCVVEIQK